MSAKFLWVSAALILVLLLTGCASAAKTSAPAPATAVPAGYPAPAKQDPTQPAAQSGYPAQAGPAYITVAKLDKSTRAITQPEFNNLPKTKVKNQEGVKLMDVLKLAGADSFNKLILTGGSSNLTLLRNEVTDQVILVPSGMAVKVVGETIQESKWIVVVTISIIE